MLKFKLLLAGLLAAAFGVCDASQNIIAPVAVRTVTFTSADIVKTTEFGSHFILNVTVAPGVETLTMKVQGKDALGNYYDLLTGTASAATGIVVLKVSPSTAPLANASANDMLPDVYRVVVTHSAGGSWTYSVTQNTWTGR